jgi:hypothetical protein
MKQFKSWLSLFLWVAFPCSLLAQQVDWSRTKAESKTTSTPTAQPEDNAKPQSESRPATPSRPVVGSNFSNPRTVRPSTPIDQWTGNRAVEIDVSQPSGTWDTLENPPQLQTEFIPQNLAASSNADLTISPASSADEAPALRSRAPHQHHPYQPGYVRKKLQKLGVAKIPYPLTKRSQLLDDDRAHSIIRTPRKGPGHQLLTATALSPREYNDQLVRGPMSLIDQDDWRKAINQWNLTETKPNHYYWHETKSFNYCHYLDTSGNQWYGWYAGNNYFWTRCYGDLWWWYDTDFNRWCFWSEGWWWWQDPYHVGDLYFYNGDQYIPCNSANDQVEVTTAAISNPVSIVSPDSTRLIKILGTEQDAFLYDTNVPAAFKPMYLASKVQKVLFVDPGDGGPYEIDLTLADGTVNFFDLQGNPLETTAMGDGTIPAPDPSSGNLPTTQQ